jgi:predicted  nucleic acid-binding Zn-ribbon protein
VVEKAEKSEKASINQVLLHGLWGVTSALLVAACSFLVSQLWSMNTELATAKTRILSHEVDQQRTLQAMQADIDRRMQDYRSDADRRFQEMSKSLDQLRQDISAMRTEINQKLDKIAGVRP